MEKYLYTDRELPFVTAWVTTSSEYTREPDPDDEWDVGDSHETLTGKGVSVGVPEMQQRELANDKCFNQEHIGFMPKAGDVVYLVVERYADGCTFGHTSGRARPVHIFKTRKAAVEWIESDEASRLKDTDYFGGHEDWEVHQVVVE